MTKYSRSSTQNVNIGGSGSGKTNVLFNLIKEQGSHKTDLYDQFLIKKREDVGIKYLNDPKAFIEYSAHLFLRTPLSGYFYRLNYTHYLIIKESYNKLLLII